MTSSKFAVAIRFYEELNDFLHKEKRKRTYEIHNNDRRSIKDLIESQRVPHTEVDLILVNGNSVGFDYQIQAGDRISVYPCFETLDISSVSRLGRMPLRDPKFIIDVNLGKLCRNLRLLGLDCLYDNTYEDGIIVEISRRMKRIILTRDRALLMRNEVTHGLFIHAADPMKQVREVIARINLEKYIRPLSRCTECNGLLAVIDKNDAWDKVPLETYRYINNFYQCATCSKLYWQGAHWKRLKAIISELTENLHGRQKTQ